MIVEYIFSDLGKDESLNDIIDINTHKFIQLKNLLTNDIISNEIEPILDSYKKRIIGFKASCDEMFAYNAICVNISKLKKSKFKQRIYDDDMKLFIIYNGGKK